MKPAIPFIPVLAALIKNEKGEFLLAQRKSTLSNGGKWEFPGGKLRISETPEECLTREIKEELGFDIIVLNPIKIVNQSYSERSILLIAYLCSYQGGGLKLRDHDQIAWVKPNILMDYDLSEPDKPIAEKLDQIYTSPELMKIEIEQSLKGTIKLGILLFEEMICQEKNEQLWREIQQLAANYSRQFSAPSEALDLLKPARDLYRKIGIEPTKTRPSSEALLRRATKGKSLYQINSIVDAGNLCSLSFLLPIGLYDFSKISGPVTLRKGNAGEEFQGIGKDAIHVGGRYTLVDQIGPFGNPSSDSLRTSVGLDTKNLLFVIYAPFEYPDQDLKLHIDFAEQKMLTYHRGRLLSKTIVS